MFREVYDLTLPQCVLLAPASYGALSEVEVDGQLNALQVFGDLFEMLLRVFQALWQVYH